MTAIRSQLARLTPSGISPEEDAQRQRGIEERAYERM